MSQIVWDHLLVHGSVILLKTGLILLDLSEKEIMNAKEFRN